ATGVLYKLALLFASSWAGILAARVVDRLGKGIRTAPRDVMVGESAEEGRLGSAFGIHKALDMAGSAIGILLSFFIVKFAGDSTPYKSIFAFSIIPSVLALCMFAFVKEKKTVNAAKQSEPFWKNRKPLNKQLKLYLFVAFVFTLGNSSNVFLLMRAKNAGFSDVSTILLYFVYNI
ncbi:MAG: MFS transporter, partial [Clostridia bacterium]